MKVFLSWSGEPSKAVARALREWLPDVIQNLRPWMSQKDLGAGVRWSPEIEGELKASSFGIICVTANNRHAPWLNFEAGAISNKLEGSRVVPYIFDMGFADIEGPLTQFQGKEATKEGTREMVQALNTAAGEQGLEAGRLHAAFERMWPELEEKLKAIPRGEGAEVSADATPHQRKADDKLDEVLVLLRNMTASPSARAIRDLESRLARTTDKQAFHYLQAALNSIMDEYPDITGIHPNFKDGELTIAIPNASDEIKVNIHNYAKI